MGTPISDLTELVTLAAGDLHVVVDVSDTTESADGTTKRITTTNVAAGVASVGNFALDSELTAHEADTTSVHGIADTSVLATASSVATAVSNHAAAVDPHADRAYADTVGNLKLAKASNLSDLANAGTARTNLGLAAIAASGSASDLSAGTVPSARLGSGGAGLGAKVLADNQTFVDLPTGTIGGSTGSVTRALILSNGTGGLTVQASGNLSQDSSGNLIIEDATGAREIWFSTVSTAPIIKRSGTGIVIMGNAGGNSPVSAGHFQQLDPNTPSTFWGIEMANARAIAFSDGVDYNRGLAKGVGQGLRITDGSTGIGNLQAALPVEASTAGSGAPNVLVATESRGVLTNEGATAENYHTLPSAVAGLIFTFIVQDADGIRITAATGDTIRPGAVAASATAGFIRCATQGAAITLIAINSTEWVATSVIGTWTVDA